MVRVISAHTTNPNTPETDKYSVVYHTVIVEVDGVWREIQLLASDPMTALDRVRQWPEQLILSRLTPQE